MPDLCFGAAVVVTNPSLNLSCNVQDVGVGVVGGKMVFSNNSSVWSAPEPYALTKVWDVSNVTYGGDNFDGTKTVYAKFSDALGNWMAQPVTTIVELVRPAPTFLGVETNLAPGATTSTAGVTPGRINDGDYLSYWQGTLVNDSVSLDFGAGKQVSRIKVYPYGPAGMYNDSWKVEYSTPAAPGVWNEFNNVAMVKKVAGKQGNGISIAYAGAAVMYDFVFPEVMVKAIRFSVLNGASDANAYLSEMEVFQNTGVKHQVVGAGAPISLGALSTFFNSSYSMSYTASSALNVAVNIQTGGVTLTPTPGWSGAEELFFTATDEHGNKVDSNKFIVAVVLPLAKPVVSALRLTGSDAAFPGHTTGLVNVAFTTTETVVKYLIKENSVVTPQVFDFTLSTKPLTYTIKTAVNGNVSISVWVLSDIGEISEVVTGTISLDTTPPTGTMSIVTP